MSDLDMLRSLLAKASARHQETSREEYLTDGGQFSGWVPHTNAVTVVRVLPGYRAHFEADFDEDGNILSIGQWESL